MMSSNPYLICIPFSSQLLLLAVTPLLGPYQHKLNCLLCAIVPNRTLKGGSRAGGEISSIPGNSEELLAFGQLSLKGMV